jgi:hypothetical protein
MANPVYLLGDSLLSNGDLAVLAGYQVNATNSAYGFDDLQVAILANNTPLTLSQTTTNLTYRAGGDPDNPSTSAPVNPEIGGGAIAAIASGGMAVLTWGGTDTNYDLQILNNAGAVTTSQEVVASESSSSPNNPTILQVPTTRTPR